MPRALADSVTTGRIDPDHAIAAFYSSLSARVGAPVSPSLKWLLAAANVRARQGDAKVAEAAARRLVDAYPEDLEGYGLVSDLALRRGDRASARRALEDAMRMLERLELFDVYDRERKRQVIKDGIAAIPR